MKNIVELTNQEVDAISGGLSLIGPGWFTLYGTLLMGGTYWWNSSKGSEENAATDPVAPVAPVAPVKKKRSLKKAPAPAPADTRRSAESTPSSVICLTDTGGCETFAASSCAGIGHPCQ